MSKVSITGNNSGTGTFTIASPNSNTNRTFNLPDETGDFLTDVSDLEPQVKTSLNATGDAPLFACRAFCNFDGTGTVSIRDNGNVSSITDNGTGFYQVNFNTAMPDGNYSAQGTAGQLTDSGTASTVIFGNGALFETTRLRFRTVRTSSTESGSFDMDVVTVSIFR